jgi:hypothetical protein
LDNSASGMLIKTEWHELHLIVLNLYIISPPLTLVAGCFYLYYCTGLFYVCQNNTIHIQF